MKGDIFEGVWQGTTPVAMKKLFNKEFSEAFTMEASMLMYVVTYRDKQETAAPKYREFFWNFRITAK